jgi:hypothetical protein
MTMEFIPKVVEALAVETSCIICVSRKIRMPGFWEKVSGRYKLQSSSVYNFLQPLLE